MSQSLREPALESSANPYRLTPEPFSDALTGLRADTRFGTFARHIFNTTVGEAYVPVEIDARFIPMLRRDPIIARH